MDNQGLQPGTILLGKYRVEELLGTGGMGMVVRASHLHLHQSVAIKVLLRSLAENPTTVARFLRESQSAVRLKSEHTARVIDVGTLPDGTPFMIMEYLEGHDLGQILKHYGRQAPDDVVDLMLQACEGLAEAHALGIVHRDIKPSNFFITRRPDGSNLLKVLDFGISTSPVPYDDLTGAQVIGTPTYMAPEQMRSGKLADARSDVWSMGVVMYQLLSGEPPFAGEGFAELVLKVGTEPPAPFTTPGISPGLVDVAMRCLEKDPARRIQNVGELARGLASFSPDPGSAHIMAQRATRILATRAGQDLSGSSGEQSRISLAGFTGPFTPNPHTPRSNPSIGSLHQGHGQVSAAAPKSRGWLIGIALAVVVAAGAGGFVAMRGGDIPAASPTHASEPAVAMPPTPPPPPATQPAVAVDAAPAVVVEPKIIAPVDAAVVDAVDAAPSAVEPPAVIEKPVVTEKPVVKTKPTKKPDGKKPKGNLFDRRD